MIVLPPSIVEFAHTLADAAGEVVRGYYRMPVPVEIKKDDSPVTLADQEAESAMRALIAEHYPRHGILGEEQGAKEKDAEFLWVLDPIDGTRSFIAGRPIFGTLIALVHQGVPVLGIIDQPINRERWVGATGQITTFNGKPVATRSCKTLSQAWPATSSPHYFDKKSFAAFERVRAACRDILYGGDCYSYALVASGFIDIVIESGLKAHDFCAMAPVINGAGGKVTDWEGKPLTLESNGDVLACGDADLHTQALALLQGKNKP